MPMLEMRQLVSETRVSPCLQIGLWLKRILPESLIAKLELEYLYLGRKLEALYELLAQALFVFLALFLAYIVNHQLNFLLASLVLPVLLLLELQLAVIDYDRQLTEDTPHLFACAKVLLINTETPLVSALRIIATTWAVPDSATVLELNKIISKIDKHGVKDALSGWQVKSDKFRDFLSFLISVSEGSSKRALRLALDKLISEAREDEKDKLSERADNLQLYLMMPVVAMLLVIMYPMAAAINYMMQNSLLGGKGL